MGTISINDIDVKLKLKEYLPEIFSVLKETEVSWKRINGLFVKTYNLRISTKQEGELIEASFFDIISKSLGGVKEAGRLVQMFRHLFNSLGSLLSETEKSFASRIIYDSLVNHDKAFFNFIGELLILNSIKKANGILLAREVLIPGTKKRIDFQFKHQDTIIFVEVVNIHIQDYANLSQQNIVFKLNSKLNRKVAEKGEGVNFYLAPVLWGGPEDLKEVRKAFLTNQITIDNLLTPSAYIHLSNQHGVNITRFGDIITLFDPPSGGLH